MQQTASAPDRPGPSCAVRYSHTTRYGVSKPVSESGKKCVHSRQAKQRDGHLDAYIRVDDVAALYAEYQSRDVMFAQSLETKPWGMREFVVWDNSGYILHFGQDA